MPDSSSPAGLSPRVRGNPARAMAAGEIIGSIPACAGEPAPTGPHWHYTAVYPRVCGGTDRTACPSTSAGRVYPRVCGGTAGFWPGSKTTLGLSPRVRGNLRRRHLPRRLLRSIPACAGEPKSKHPAPFVPGVYPRVCGGTAFAACPTWGITGLSPRVRGNLIATLFYFPLAGSIPACAGEPSPDCQA